MWRFRRNKLTCANRIGMIYCIVGFIVAALILDKILDVDAYSVS